MSGAARAGSFSLTHSSVAGSTRQVKGRKSQEHYNPRGAQLARGTPALRSQEPVQRPDGVSLAPDGVDERRSAKPDEIEVPPAGFIRTRDLHLERVMS